LNTELDKLIFLGKNALKFWGWKKYRYICIGNEQASIKNHSGYWECQKWTNFHFARKRFNIFL